jgi:tRNA pseudouridine38-40 synthase
MGKYYYKLIVEYDGTDFSGWQIQPEKRTVQDILQNTVRLLTREKAILLGAGRTDAGVHAEGQVAAFSLDKFIEPAELYYRLNRMLPDDIAIKKITPAKDRFDPRRDAYSRIYRYYIAESPNALYRHIHYQSYRPLNIDILNKAAALFRGNHDFTAFCKTKSLKQDNHCEVYVSRWFRYSGALIYEVKANRFLHHMVRRLVGAMIAVENSKIGLTHIKAFLNNKGGAKYNAPARGLVLIKVNYRRERQ